MCVCVCVCVCMCVRVSVCVHVCGALSSTVFWLGGMMNEREGWGTTVGIQRLGEERRRAVEEEDRGDEDRRRQGERRKGSQRDRSKGEKNKRRNEMIE